MVNSYVSSAYTAVNSILYRLDSSQGLILSSRYKINKLRNSNPTISIKNRLKTDTNTQELSSSTPDYDAYIHWGNKFQAFALSNSRVKKELYKEYKQQNFLSLSLYFLD